MSRPELQRPPDLFYDHTEARKYTSSSRIVQVPMLSWERKQGFFQLPVPAPLLPRMYGAAGCAGGVLLPRTLKIANSVLLPRPRGAGSGVTLAAFSGSGRDLGAGH